MGERMTTEPRTETWVLVAALRELARTIASDDGVANAAIGEAADRLEASRTTNCAANSSLHGLPQVCRMCDFTTCATQLHPGGWQQVPAWRRCATCSGTQRFP